MKSNKRKEWAQYAVLFGLLILSMTSAKASSQETPPMYALKIYASASDSRFEFGQILPTQNEGVFVYDEENNLALVFSNIVFSKDTRKVRFALSGDEIDGERWYFLTVGKEPSSGYANVIAGEYKIRIAMEGIVPTR